MERPRMKTLRVGMCRFFYQAVSLALWRKVSTMPDFITHERFVQYFPALVLDQRTLPKKREAVITLLVSAMIEIDIGKAYTEWSISTKLQYWVDAFGRSIRLDRVALRRMLVDEGYLHRDRFGATYVLAARSPYFGYEPSIRSVNLRELVAGFEQQRAVRKHAMLQSMPPADS